MTRTKDAHGRRAITALMTGHAYSVSARTALRMGPFAGYHARLRGDARGAPGCTGRKQRTSTRRSVPPELLSAAQAAWDEAVEFGERYGVRNSQASVLAPDRDDRPADGLRHDRDRARSRPGQDQEARRRRDDVDRQPDDPEWHSRSSATQPEQVEEIVTYVNENSCRSSVPRTCVPSICPVFACSMGENSIHYSGHIRMMGAVQPFISGAISKTINMPEDVTVEDVEQLHLDAWRLGLKAVAVYRDNCKVGSAALDHEEGGDRRLRLLQGLHAEAHDRELAARIAELEKALDAEQKRADVIVGAVRERLPRASPFEHVHLPRRRLRGLCDGRRVRRRPSRARSS